MKKRLKYKKRKLCEEKKMPNDRKVFAKNSSKAD
jgi:hypothetical protein